MFVSLTNATVGRMTDHYAKTLDLLEEVEDLTGDLADAYRDGAPREHVANIHGELGRSLKLADIHATLSVRQALEDRAIAPAGSAFL